MSANRWGGQNPRSWKRSGAQGTARPTIVGCRYAGINPERVAWRTLPQLTEPRSGLERLWTLGIGPWTRLRTCVQPYVGQSVWITMITEDDIRNALKAVKYPGFSRDIVSFGLIKEVSMANGAVSVSMELTSSSPEAVQQIKADS